MRRPDRPVEPLSVRMARRPRAAAFGMLLAMVVGASLLALCGGAVGLAIVYLVHSRVHRGR